MSGTSILRVVVSALLVCSCGGADKASKETPAQASPQEIARQQQEADRIVKEQMGKVQQREAATFPCRVFTQSDIESIAGNPLERGNYMFNNVTEDTHTFKSESCDWSARGSGNEVALWVSQPAHFQSGHVECAPGMGKEESATAGDRAWWDYKKSFGMGTLRVCSSKAMLEVRVIVTDKDEATAKRIAQRTSEKVLASL